MESPHVAPARIAPRRTAGDAPTAVPAPKRTGPATSRVPNDVPVAVAQQLFDHASGPDIRLTLVKGADHRFSTPDCLALIESSLDEILA